MGFSSNAEFEIHILSGGEKRCILRWPTDDEWCQLTRKRKVLRESIGRGKSQSRVLGAEASAAELFTKVRIDQDGTPFDEAEASAAISKLERCRVVACEREGDAFRITMNVPGGAVVHLVNIPLQSDLMAFSRAAAPPIIEGRRSQEIRTFLEPSGELWAKIGTAVSGYAEGSAVPIVHKDAAITELLQQMGAAEEDQDPED
jgi:hypothetical protein